MYMCINNFSKNTIPQIESSDRKMLHIEKCVLKFHKSVYLGLRVLGYLRLLKSA